MVIEATLCLTFKSLYTEKRFLFYSHMMMLEPSLCHPLALTRRQPFVTVRFLGLPGAVTHWRGQPFNP